MKQKLFLLLFIFATNFLFAQISNFNFRNINISDGLSNNTISSITEDKFGQIWIGTSNGLNKYNGKEFTIYRNTPGKSNSISSSETINVLSDKEGYIWIGTFNGLNRFDPKTNTFKRFYKRPTIKYSLSHSLVRCSLEMPGGNIWFGTENGVSIYEKKKNRFLKFLQRDPKKGIRSINNMILDHKKNVWLATNKGIVNVERGKRFTINDYSLTTEKNNFVVNSLLEITPGVIGVATRNNGFLYFNTTTKEFSRPKEINLPVNIDVRDMEIDDDNNIWLATTSGLYIITPSKETIYLKENQVNSNGIIQNFIKTIYKDKNGMMWLGTENGGVLTWDKSYQNFLHHKNYKLSNNITNSIVAGKDATIYVATEGGVVNTFNKQKELSTLFKVESLDKNINHPIRSLYFQNPNLLFVGTLNKGLIVYDVNTKKKRDDVVSEELKNYIATTAIYDIKIDSKDNLYLATFGKGLVKYNLSSKRLRVFSKSHITITYLKTIYIDKNDNLWVAGIGGATAIKFNNQGKLSRKNFFRNKPFKTFNINYIYKDNNNEVWAGSNTRGLYKLVGNVFRKVRFSKKNTFSMVNSIIEDDDGILWLSTDKGIVKYNSKSDKSFIYNQNNIIGNNDFRQNSALKVDNQIYFGHLYGVTSFNSKKLIKVNKVPKVVLSELKIKNEIVTIKGTDSILANGLNFADHIKLTHNNSNFSISYALPNFINPTENRYAYRLKGLDDSWTFTKQTEAFFTLQSAGTYEFQVKAANHDYVWNNNPTKIKIIIGPAPWKTWWAYTIYFLLLFAIFYGFSWFVQSKSRLKDKLELEYIANKKNEELNQVKLQFFTNISHEFRTPLTLIIGPLQNILNNYKGSSEIHKKLKIIESSTNHLLRLINRLMDFRKLESNQFQLEAAEGNIVKFLQEIFLSFTEHAKDGNYNYQFIPLEDEILVYYDRYKLERVFYNLISNAFRYTEKGGTILVKLKQENEQVIIEVEDSGVGIADEFLDKIFDRFFEVAVHKQTDENHLKGTGIGLSIAKNIVELHHGEITVVNLKPHGARFSVALKLGVKHLSEKEIIKDFKKSDDVSQYVTQINLPECENKQVEDLILKEKKYTILIVEDNVVLRSFMKEILKEKYNILVAENGQVALDKAIKHMPDLIVSDVVMPKMVGTELCSKIKTNITTSHIPVILLTSRSSLIYKFEGLESGADDYITKPFVLKEFKLKIKNILDSKQNLKNKFISDSSFESLDISLTSIDQKLLDKAFKIVKENIANQEFNIAQFAEDLGVSRSMLFTKIKAWANATPNEFIQEIRLNHAAKLLEINELNISEVSYQVGFKRPKYFSQCFKKKYGLTPSEFSDKFNSNNI